MHPFSIADWIKVESGNKAQELVIEVKWDSWFHTQNANSPKSHFAAQTDV
jgi:hypothetical protein